MPTKKPSEKPAAAPAAGGFDLSVVAALAKIAAANDLSEVEVEREGLRIRVARERQSVAATQFMPFAAPSSPPPRPPLPRRRRRSRDAAPADHPGAVKSPMVGTAYLRPSPEAKPFVEIGSIGEGRATRSCWSRR